MIRTFRIGRHIWFYLHYDAAGVLTAVEEHDPWSGGAITPHKDETLGDLFVGLVSRRLSGAAEFNDAVTTQAKEFLVSNVKEIDSLDKIHGDEP
jgi:hypothetical protein